MEVCVSVGESESESDKRILYVMIYVWACIQFIYIMAIVFPLDNKTL